MDAIDKSNLFEAQYTTDNDLLASLSTNANDLVRDKVAANHNTPTYVVDKLTTDESFSISAKALRNPNISDTVLNEALKNGNYKIRFEATKNRKLSSEQLAQMTKEVNPKVVSAIIMHENITSNVLKQFASHTNPQIRKLALTNPIITTEDLFAFAEETDNDVIYNIIRHPNSNSALFEWFIDEPHSAHVIASQLKTNSELLTKIAFTHNADTPKNFLISKTIAVHPNCPQSLLEKYSTGVEEIVLRVAKNTATNNEILYKIAENCSSKDVRLIAVNQLSKRDEFKDWPVEWVEERFGVKL